MDSKETLSAFFNYATQGILVADAAGSIIRVNPSAERMFGYADGQLVGEKIEVLIPAAARSRHEQHRDHYAHNPRPRSMGAGMDLTALRRDGSEFPVEISLSPYETGGQKFVIAFIIDITIRKQQQDAIRALNASLENKVRERTLVLEEALDELRRSKEEIDRALAKEKDLNELKTRFVAMASHEFRTPLATILSSLELVERYIDKGDFEKRHKHIDRIRKSVGNMTDILNDVLSLSKLEEGKVEAHPEEFRIEKFITDIVQDMQGNAPAGLTIDYAHEGAADFCTDPKLLNNILLNLLSNAIKFSPSGGTVRVRSHVSSKGEETQFQVAVSDQGIGISPEDQEHLFERFFRAGNALNIGGTGLGLSIVARYVELLSGTIAVKSSIGEGTTFTLHFQHP